MPSHSLRARVGAVYRLAAILALSLCVTLPAFAQKPAASADAAPVRALSPAQIDAIRGIGRNVLEAKRSGRTDAAADAAADAAQLEQLRTTVNALLAHDFDPKHRTSITVKGEKPDARRQVSDETRARHAAERSQARTFAGQLKARKAQVISRTRTAADDRTDPMKRTMTEQRAELFEKWGRKLEVAAADDNPDRVRQLHELQTQLRATRGQLVQAPLKPATPTLQAMPANRLAGKPKKK